jgi:uncharacterized protein (DUF433 family)
MCCEHVQAASFGNTPAGSFGPDPRAVIALQLDYGGEGVVVLRAELCHECAARFGRVAREVVIPDETVTDTSNPVENGALPPLAPACPLCLERWKAGLPRECQTGEMELLDRITQGSSGPCLRGTGITVWELLRRMASGNSEQQVLESWPLLESDDIKAAKAFLVNALRSATHGARDLGITRRQLIELLDSPHLSIWRSIPRKAG